MKTQPDDERGTRPVLCAGNTTLTLTLHVCTCYTDQWEANDGHTLESSASNSTDTCRRMGHFLSTLFFSYGRFILSATTSTRVYIPRQPPLKAVFSSSSSSSSVRLCWRRFDRTLLLAATNKAGVVSPVVSSRPSTCS